VSRIHHCKFHSCLSYSCHSHMCDSCLLSTPERHPIAPSLAILARRCPSIRFQSCVVETETDDRLDTTNSFQPCAFIFFPSSFFEYQVLAESYFAFIAKPTRAGVSAKFVRREVVNYALTIALPSLFVTYISARTSPRTPCFTKKTV
jgi:hypothetical protein